MRIKLRNYSPRESYKRKFEEKRGKISKKKKKKKKKNLTINLVKIVKGKTMVK